MLRVALPLTLLLFILAGCGNAYMEGRSSASNTQDSSGDRENKVASLVSGMSVRDMVGQMFVVSVGGTQPDYYIEKMVRKRNIGGVILFGYNMKSEGQVESLTGRLQQFAMKTEPAVPLFVAVDQEGGGSRRGFRGGRRSLDGQALSQPRTGNLRLAREPACHKARCEDPPVLRPAAFRGRHRGGGAHGDGRAPRLPGHRPPSSRKPFQRCHKHVAQGSRL